MNFKIKTIALLLSAVCIMTSCLGDNDVDTTTYDDAAVSSFTLGSLKAYLHTTSSKGTDSIYSVSVTGSKYKVYIDQLKNEIYNVDSLPLGTDMKHVLVTVNAKNSGIPVLKSITSDSISVFGSTDSLDFSVERELQVFSLSRQYKRSYKVNLVAHKEVADSFVWTKMPESSQIAAYDNVSATAFMGNIFVIGAKGTSAEFIKTATNDGKSWSAVSFPTQLTAEAKMVELGDELIVTDAETIYSTYDGNAWTSKEAKGIKQVLGYCNGELYALSTDGTLMVSTDDAKTWKAEELDNSKALMPTVCCNTSVNATITNAEVSRIILIGNRDENVYAQDKTAMIWTKIVDAGYPQQQMWSYQKFEEYNKKYLPCMENLCVINYCGGMLAIGGKGTGNSSVKAYGKLYFSTDNGITWDEDKRFVLPSGFATGKAVMTVDENNFIWILSTTTGQVWRGRLNELGWANSHTTVY